MSRDQGPVGLAIEWSPRGVVAYDATTRSTKVADDLPSLGLSGREAILALSRRGVFVRTVRVPNASHEEVRTILTIQAGDLFPLPVIDLAWEFILTDDVTSEGRLAVLAAVPCADLRRSLDAAAAAGLKVRAAIPLALGSIMLAQEMGLSEAALVERSDDGPAVDIISGGTLRASRATPASVPLELEVTRALSLAGIDSAPIVSAGDAQTPNAAYHTDRTALQALADSPYDRLKLHIELPEAITARAAAASRNSSRLAVTALVASVALAAWAYMDWSSASETVRRQTVQSGSRLQKIKNELKKASGENSTQVAMKDALDLAFAPAQKVSDVIAVATAAVPKGVWLNAASVERGKPLTLRGTSKGESLVADLVRKLDQNPEKRFRDVQLTNANNTLVNREPVTIFVISAFPVGNLPFLGKSGGSTVR